MKTSNLLVTVVVALIVAGGVAWTVSGTSAPTQPQNVGSLTGPDIASPYLKWGGLATYRTSAPLKTATTTLCAIQSPAATSSLMFAAWVINTGTSTAATIDLATSTTAFATTTNLVAATVVGSSGKGAVSWSSAGTNGVLAPNTWVVTKTAGAGLSGYTYGGTCDAEFTVL